MDLFTAIDITKKFSNHTALDKVSVTIPENSIFGLLGPQWCRENHTDQDHEPDHCTG